MTLVKRQPSLVLSVVATILLCGLSSRSSVAAYTAATTSSGLDSAGSISNAKLACLHQQSTTNERVVPPSFSRGRRKRRKVRGNDLPKTRRTLTSDENSRGQADESITGYSGDTDTSVSVGSSRPSLTAAARKMSGGKGGGKGGGGSSSTSTSTTKSMKKSGSKSKKSTGKSKKKSSKTSSGNIFDHQKGQEEYEDEEEVEKEIVQVQCGTDESPFLTTFVASIQLQQPEPSRNRMGKGSKMKSERYDTELADEYDEDVSLMELPTNALSPGEQRLMERTFREVYNNWTFDHCDGFFRVVYTVSMTLASMDEDDEEYSVTLEDTYRMDGEDVVQLRIVNGTMPEDARRRLLETNSSMPYQNKTGNETSSRSVTNITVAPNEANGTLAPTSAPTEYNSAGVPATPPKEQETKGSSKDKSESGDEDIPTGHSQTVTGGENLPIYYVSFAATCRNCDVTAELNFPLLMLPEDDAANADTGLTMGEPIGVSAENGTVVEGEAICTCPVFLESNEEEISRRRHNRRRLAHEQEPNLYVPPPMAPTAEQFILAMNRAIRKLQDREGSLLRVAGIVELIEPDYFQGENPDPERGPTSAPTVSPMPTVSSHPTEAPTISPAPSISALPTLAPSIGNLTWNTTSSEAPTFSSNITELTRPPTRSPVTAPPEARSATASPTTSSAFSSAWHRTATWMSFVASAMIMVLA